MLKASFTWDETGQTHPAETEAIVERDQYAGDPATSGLSRAAEIGPPKKRVDVLLAGSLAFGRPTTEGTAVLALGQRIKKVVSLVGMRVWEPGLVAEAIPSKPRPVTRLPILWERSFGGTDPEDRTCLERRNPVGSGVARRAASLHGREAPNFEHPDHGLRSWKDRPPPIGFGPIASHWHPRALHAGTYTETWMKEENPAAPEDFDAGFYNVAPEDQQVADYLPGERVLLLGMTVSCQERFALPVFSQPVRFLTRDELREDVLSVDTIIIEPERHRLTLLARAAIAVPNVLALRQIVIGALTRAQLVAVETGKAARFTPRTMA